MPLLTCLILLYYLYLLLERRANDMARRSFLHVIHVNGIRGKTGTCRALDAVLRSKYRVFTKTTGTDAAVIDVNGNELPIRRIGPASIGEQIRIMRRAKREGAEILIIECMAVNPALQKASQEQIVRGDISVITNVRYDHILDMGETKEEIADALSAVIPDHGLLVTADPDGSRWFEGACRALGTELVLCPSSGDSSDNIAIAHIIAERLGIGEEEFAHHLQQIQEDFGVSRLYRVCGPDGVPYSFLNLFSVNDPESTEAGFRKILSASDQHPAPAVAFLYNHRADRPDRALLFAKHFFPNHRDVPLYLCGSGLSLPTRLFLAAGVGTIRFLPARHFGAKPPAVFPDISGHPRARHILPNLPEGSLLVGIGNIKGVGYSLIEELDASTRAPATDAGVKQNTCQRGRIL